MGASEAAETCIAVAIPLQKLDTNAPVMRVTGTGFLGCSGAGSSTCASSSGTAMGNMSSSDSKEAMKCNFAIAAQTLSYIEIRGPKSFESVK